MRWYVYLLRCGNGALYTGISIDVATRVQQHQAGKGSSYVRQHGAQAVVYSERHRTKSAAMKRECEIKGWTRRKKLGLFGTRLVPSA